MKTHLQKLFALVLFCGFYFGTSTVWGQVQHEPFSIVGSSTNSTLGWAKQNGSTAGEMQIMDGSSTVATDATLAFASVTPAGTPTKIPAISPSISLENFKSANTHLAYGYTPFTESAEKNFVAQEVKYDFGIVDAWTLNAPIRYYTFKAVGFTEAIVINSNHPDFELSKTNTDGSFFQSVTYSAAETAEGEEQELFIRFLPKSKFIKFDGVVTATSGNDFEKVLATLTGSSILKENTLDVVTWNLDWFGSESNGPDDEALQYENAKKAITALQADIIGVQEVVDEAKIEQLAQELGYQYVSEAMSGDQKLGFLYNPDVVTVKQEKILLSKLYADIKSDVVTLENYPGGNADLLWSGGRLPYMVQFEAIIGDKKQTFRIVNIHAKANDGEDMMQYNRRKFDVQVLKDSLDAQYANTNLILLGDFNDDVDVSVVGTGNPSTYDPFVSDEDFVAITLDLSKTGAYSYESEAFKSFLDHIIISRRLEDEYIENSIKVETQLLRMISSFKNTTSGHIPVSARFELTSAAAISFSEASVTTTEDAGTVTVSLTLSSAATTEQTVTVSAATGGTASASDYTLTDATEGVVTITVPANATTATFQVNITDDTEEETEEQVVFTISGISDGIELGANKTFTLIITDNDAPTGIADGTEGQFNVYPNPVDDATGIRLTLPERIAAQTRVNLTVYSLDGKRALNMSGTIAEVQEQLNKASAKLAGGMYIILVQAGKEYFQTKLMKQ